MGENMEFSYGKWHFFITIQRLDICIDFWHEGKEGYYRVRAFHTGIMGIFDSILALNSDLYKLYTLAKMQPKFKAFFLNKLQIAKERYLELYCKCEQTKCPFNYAKICSIHKHNELMREIEALENYEECQAYEYFESIKYISIKNSLEGFLFQMPILL